MNAILQKFARQYLKENLIKLSEERQNLFKLMYANCGPISCKAQLALAFSIEEVVDQISAEKLDLVMQQVENSLVKIQHEKDKVN